MEFPSGCRIFFSLFDPEGKPLIEDILNARSYSVGYGQLIEFRDDYDKIVRLVNFAHVFIILPLETVGPASASN